MTLLFNKKMFKAYDREYFNFFVGKIYECILNNVRKKSTFLDIKETNKAIILKNKVFFSVLESHTGKTKKTLKCNLILINDNLLVGISAEVHSCYYDYIGSRFPMITVFPVGYTDGVVGYLPCEDEIGDGGYEVIKSCSNYGWDGHISSQSIIDFKKALVENINIILFNNHL
jgi:hypothetical protein